jgi:hypothetical protein
MKIVGARRVKLNKLNAEDPQTLGAAIHNLVATAIWRPRFVRSWLGV